MYDSQYVQGIRKWNDTNLQQQINYTWYAHIRFFNDRWLLQLKVCVQVDYMRFECDLQRGKSVLVEFLTFKVYVMMSVGQFARPWSFCPAM